MTDQNDSEQTRRTFVKGAAATGVAATGITAFSGSAAAQQPRAVIRSVSRNIFNQDGQQGAAGVIVVQVQNVAISALNTVNVVITDLIEDIEIDVNIEDIRILNNNIVQIIVADAVDVVGNQVQVAVNLLGVQDLGGQNIGDLTAEDTIRIDQRARQ